MLAGAIVFFWVGGLVLAGVIGVFLMALVLAFKVLRFIVRLLTGREAHPRPQDQYVVHAPPSRTIPRGQCPHVGCGKANAPEARFCGRCGRPLRPAYETDTYG